MVTRISPVVAPEGTVAVIRSSFTIENCAPRPLNVTEVAPVKWFPSIVTLVPTGPLRGEKLSITGAPPVTVNTPLLSSNPAGVVTRILPVVASEGTVAVIRSSFTTENCAPRPLNVTEVAPVKWFPSIVTLVPTGPLRGEKLPMAGAVPVTVKGPKLSSKPAGVVTRIFPVVASAGTVAVIRSSFTTENCALWPLNVTDVAPVKWFPSIVTVVPTGPLRGEKLPMAGALLVTVKSPKLESEPERLPTAIFPVVASLGTTAVMRSSLTKVNCAAWPLNVTEVAPVKLFPSIVTVVPTGPLRGRSW